MKFEDAAAALEASLADEVARHDAAASQARAKLAEAAEARERLAQQSAADAQASRVAARQAAAPAAWRAFLGHLAHEERLIEQAEAVAAELVRLEAAVRESQPVRQAGGVGHPKAGRFLKAGIQGMMLATRQRRPNLARDRAEALRALADAEAANPS